MIDDLGYGDIGCYGSQTNKTPNIDRLAEKGMRFTDFHSNGPMCTPTRAAFMTGKYQHRFGKNFEGALSGVDDYDIGLPLEAVTIAEVLKKAGYATGMYGKWHLGYHPPFFPADQGFDDFWGLGSGDGDHHTHIDRSGREDWWHNNELNMEKGYSTHLITEHSIDFIKTHQDSPFFLYISHLAIHFPWQGPEDPPHRVSGVNYAEDKWGIIPDRKNVSPHVKAMVETIDTGMGKIIKTLEDLQLDKNTLVIFTSDNGGYINYNSGGFENISSNGPLRGQKAEVYEGGHRVPFIAYWPGKIKAGIATDETVMTMDMFPTFTALANHAIPEKNQLDGINILPLLFENTPLPERTLFWKMGNEIAVRKGPWKLVHPEDNNVALYNLTEDIGEQEDLSKEKPELVKALWNEYESWKQEVTIEAMKNGKE
jgi:arylsulfatase A-like enzyme